MNTIIIICNDPRISIVKKRLELLILGKVTITPDFEAGMMAIFSKKPEVVFLQNEINGIKAKTVASHVKALLKTNAPQLILLGIPYTQAEGLACFNGYVDMSIPYEHLADECIELMKSMPMIRWKNPVLMTSEAAKVPPKADHTGRDGVF